MTITNIIHTLKRAGYNCLLTGLQHIAAEPGTIGFDEMLPPAILTPAVKLSAAVVAPAAAAFIEANRQEPFSWMSDFRKHIGSIRSHRVRIIQTRFCRLFRSPTLRRHEWIWRGITQARASWIKE